MKEKIENALNTQMNFEFYSSYTYLAMSAYFDATGMEGMSSWMQLQANEEWGHGMKFYNFINERGGRVKLDKIDQPTFEYNSVLEVFEETLEHEKLVTSKINDVYALAVEERDFATQNFLNWFVEEQVEEEDAVNTILDKLKLIGSSSAALFMVDKDLGARTSAPDGAEEE